MPTDYYNHKIKQKSILNRGSQYLGSITCMNTTAKHAPLGQLGVKCGMICHQTFKVQQLVKQIFALKMFKISCRCPSVIDTERLCESCLHQHFCGNRYMRSCKTTFTKVVHVSILTQVRVSFSEEVFNVQSFCHFVC